MTQVTVFVFAVCVSAWGGLTGDASAADAEVIAVLPLRIENEFFAQKADIEAEIVKGLRIAARPVRPPGETQHRLDAARAPGDCESAACWLRLGAAAGATHLITGTIERRGGNVWAGFRIMRARDGQQLGAEENQCEANACKISELSGLSIWELARKALGPGEPLGPLLLPAPAGRSPSPRSEVIAPPPRWPWVVLGMGAAATLGGAILLSTHGDCGGANCPSIRPGRAAGFASLGAGLAAAGSATMFLLWPGRF